MEFLALLLPILIDYIARKVADSDIRLLISVIVCSVVGLGLVWLDTSFVFVNARVAFDTITSQIMVVFGLAQLSFHAVWSKTDTHKELRAEANK